MNDAATQAPSHGSTAVDPIDRRRGGIALLLTVLLTASIAFQLNASMLSPALRTMAQDLNTDEATTGLTQTAFFTAGAMCALFLPRLSDMVGRRRILGIMMGIMTVGAIIAALAPTIEILLVARALQGIAGPTIPMTMLILRSQIHNQIRLGTLMGLVAAVNGGIAGIDVLLAGWMVENWGFRSLFWLIAFFGIIACLVVFFFTPESKPSAGQSMDWLGAILLVFSVLPVTLAANEAGKAADAHWGIVLALVLMGLVIFALFWAWENRHQYPLVATRYLRRRATWALLLTTLLTMIGVFAAVNGVAVSLAQNEEAGFGLSPADSSVYLLLPYALFGWLVGPFAGRLAPRIGYPRLIRIGNIGSAIFLLLLAFMGIRSLSVLILGVILLGITYAGIGNIVLSNLGVVTSPPDNEGFLPGMNSSMFNLGAGISFAILPVFMVAGSPAGSDSTAGYTAAFTVGAVFLGLSILSSLLIPSAHTSEDVVKK